MYGTEVVKVRYQVLRVHSGSYKGKGKYLSSVTVIPEEFGNGPIRLDHLADILAGAIVRRKSLGHDDGTAILAEGLIEQLPAEDFEFIPSGQGT